MRTPAKPPPSAVPAPAPTPKKAPARSPVPQATFGRSLLDLPVSAPRGDSDAREIAERGFRGPAQPLPFRERLEAELGHDLSGVKAYIGGSAAVASDELHARAYAADGRIAFRQAPDLKLAAHEAAHVVQQRLAPSSGGLSDASDRSERTAHAIADRVVAGVPARGMLSAAVPAAAIQRDQTPDWTPEQFYFHIVETWETTWLALDPGPDRAHARRMWLLLNRPKDFKTHDEVTAFVNDCDELAKDEQKTWDALAKEGATEETFIAEGEAFPNLWADRVYKELYGTADERVLADRFAKARTEALANVSGISDEIWARGLPLSRDQAARFKRPEIPELALNFKYAKAHPNEALGRYAKLLVQWERTLAHYYLIRGFRFQLKSHVDQIRKGEVVIGKDTHAEVFGARFFHLKLAVFENAASSPDDMNKAFTALLLQKPTHFFRGGYTSGIKYRWPDEAVKALWSEIWEVDDKLKAASFDERVWRSMVWAYERGYFGEAAIDAYNAIKDDWLKMIATAVAIIVAQAIPGLNIAVDIVLLIEFGVDVLQTLFDLKDAFEAAGDATKVEAMQRASIKMANTLVGLGVKIVIWAATWGTRKVGSQIKKYREGKKFLDDHGNSPEARDALKNAKGDVEKARKSLEAKREAERVAKAKQEKAKREREEAERKQREQEEAKRKQEEEAKRRQEEEAKRRQEEEAKRRQEEEAKRSEEPATRRADDPNADPPIIRGREQKPQIATDTHYKWTHKSEPRGNYVDATLDKDGGLSVTVRARGPNRRGGKKLISDVFKHFAGRIKSFKSRWYKGGKYDTNYNEYMANLKKGMSKEDAALDTWIGRELRDKYGFKKVTVPEHAADPDSVFPVFTP